MLRVLNTMSALVVVVASLLIFSGHSYAHERRTVGQFDLEVGWLVEPAFVGQVNGLSLHVADTRTHGPISALDKTLMVEVAAGGLTPFALTLSGSQNAGEYTSALMPTVAGSYTFHITGKIGAQTLDEKFSSGPNTFDDIADLTALQYPARVPVGANLGRRLDSIQSDLDQTRILAIAALALAVLGFGGAALARRRSA